MNDVSKVTDITTASDDDGFDCLFKIVVIGDCGVGKTCVVQRFKSGNYIERHGNTIGVDFSMKTLNIEGKRIKVCKASYSNLTCNLRIYIFRINVLSRVVQN